MTEKAAEWAERVRAWRGSGKSAAVFAAEHGVSEATLRWWAKRLEIPAIPGVHPQRSAKTAIAAPSIAIARVVRTAAATPTPRRAPVTVVVGEACVLVDAGADEGALRVVFRALGVAR